jgi:hypothetical protein
MATWVSKKSGSAANFGDGVALATVVTTSALPVFASIGK